MKPFAENFPGRPHLNPLLLIRPSGTFSKWRREADAFFWRGLSFRAIAPISFGEGQGVRLEYDLLIYVANWPQRRNHAWKTLLQARAIENQCYVIGVNRVGDDGKGIHYSGDSMIIDPLGEILYSKTNDEDVFTYTLQKDKLMEVRNKFPFWKDSDSFIINT